jgi:glycosyltransferase involved in cell wall biosynthesis
MRIINAMFGRGKGGIEQAFLNFSDLLRKECELLTLCANKSWAGDELAKMNIEKIEIPHLAGWDLLAKYRIKQIARKFKADYVFLHGNRAIDLFAGADVKKIAIANNYSSKRLPKMQHIFAVTNDIKQHLQSLQIPAEKISIIPNFIKLDVEKPQRIVRNPPIIGSIGRFVAKKGYHDLLAACEILDKRGVEYKLLLGGDGEEKDSLINRLSALKNAEYIGWVEDKAKFYADIDIFILPSHHEPFGIVLLEAMKYGCAIISSDVEGPSEILHKDNGILYPVKDCEKLADEIENLLKNPDEIIRLGENSYQTIVEKYQYSVIKEQIFTALTKF